MHFFQGLLVPLLNDVAVVRAPEHGEVPEVRWRRVRCFAAHARDSRTGLKTSGGVAPTRRPRRRGRHPAARRGRAPIIQTMIVQTTAGRTGRRLRRRRRHPRHPRPRVSSTPGTYRSRCCRSHCCPSPPGSARSPSPNAPISWARWARRRGGGRSDACATACDATRPAATS